jgi:hypothetical protein
MSQTVAISAELMTLEPMTAAGNYFGRELSVSDSQPDNLPGPRGSLPDHVMQERAWRRVIQRMAPGQLAMARRLASDTLLRSPFRCGQLASETS